MVGTTALRALRLAILFLLFGVSSSFAEITAYECAPGTPIKGVGCKCPNTHSSKIVGGTAQCMEKPKTYGGGGYGNYDALVQKANDHADAYNCKKAEEVYQQALRIKPNGLEALVGSGNCLARQSKWTNAHARFDKALRVNARYEPALWGKAEAYRLAYRKDDAIAAYKQYLVYYPNTIKAQQALDKLGVSSGVNVGISGGNRPGRYPSRTQDVWCSISGSSITCNGVSISGKPSVRDWEGIYGKPDRTWDTKGGVNKVHTWDRLGIVVYEPVNGRGKAVSMTMPYKPMGMAYDPSTSFAGSITVDGYSLSASTRLADVIRRPGVTQPYSSTSALWAKGDFNVFMTGRNGPLDLVELSLWKNDTGTNVQVGGGGRYKSTRELKITVNNGSVQLNGVSISGKPKMTDIERIYGKWDRIWDTGSSNRVYTWDNLGLVAYENRDSSGRPTGNCISTTFPYKPMGSQYDPKVMFDGTITVDGRAMTKYNTIATIRTRPNAGQPYGTDSIVFDWGDVHVFTIAKSGGAIDLVEVSYWNKDRGMSTKKSGGGRVANASDVRVEVTKDGRVKINGTAISGKPMVSDFKRVYGEPDRVWDKKGGANRIHTWDSLGIILYEPYNGRAISLTMPYKRMSGDFSPSTLFKGRVSLDGRGFYNFNTIGTIKNRPGARQPYGATSVVFDFGDVHVFTTAKAATTETIDLVEVSFWNKNR